jgi:hypothetical protein
MARANVNAAANHSLYRESMTMPLTMKTRHVVSLHVNPSVMYITVRPEQYALASCGEH